MNRTIGTKTKLEDWLDTWQKDIDKYYQFDAATEAAVRFFQESLKVTMPWITVDGRIGRQTWDLLFKTVTDTLERNEFRETFKLYNSPIDKKGNV